MFLYLSNGGGALETGYSLFDSSVTPRTTLLGNKPVKSLYFLGFLVKNKNVLSGLCLTAFNTLATHSERARAKVKQYLGKKKLLQEANVTQSQINDVFNHICEFFSRYYDKGDFVSKRRYGGKNKYYIPYNGEEVAFYWATKDMYYVKTGEFFKKYSFRSGKYLVTFVLTEAKVEVGNVKSEKKYFILSQDSPVTIDDAASLVEIRFNYRGLSQEESSKLVKSDIQAAARARYGISQFT